METEQENPELVLTLQTLARLKGEQNRLIRENGISYYRPHDKQDRFHRAATGNVKGRMLRCGNRFGKSKAGVAEDIAMAMMERPWYKRAFDIHNREGALVRHHEGGENHPFVRAGIPQRPTKGLVIGPDWDKIHEIFTAKDGDKPGKFWELLPADLVKGTDNNHSGVIDKIILRNGSTISFDTEKSYKTNKKGAESSDWDWIHVDEPCSEGFYKAAARGLIDRAGIYWFLLTPLEEFWINDHFFPEETGGKSRDKVWACDGSIYDNPYLPEESIRDFASLLTEEEKQCRLFGIPLHLAGLIYKSFSWDRHVLKDYPKDWNGWMPPKHWPVYVKIDPHPRTPHAVLACAVSPFGERYYFYDHFKHCSIEELSSDVLTHLAGYTIVSCEADPLAFIEHPVSCESMAQEFDRCGLYVDKATKALEQGILHVNQELGKVFPIQQIYFTPHCKRTLWEIQRYSWDSEKEKPVDKDDHMMENLYRMELGDPVWVDLKYKNVAIDELVINRTDLSLGPIQLSAFH